MATKDNTFELHPSLDRYFETSDGKKFYTENAAQNWAKGLENRKIKCVERSSNEPKSESPKVDNSETFDFQEMGFDALKDYMNSNGIEGNPKSKKEAREMIEKAQNGSDSSLDDDEVDSSENGGDGSEGDGSEVTKTTSESGEEN